jgi:hypothetical protein
MLRYNLSHKKAAESLSFSYALKNAVPVIAFTSTRWNRLLKQDPLGNNTNESIAPPTTADCIKFALSHPAVEMVIHSARDEKELMNAFSSLEETFYQRSSDWLSEEEHAFLCAYGDNERKWNEKDGFDEYPSEINYL